MTKKQKTKDSLEDIRKIAEFQSERYFDKEMVNRKLVLRQALDIIIFRVEEIKLNEKLD